MNTIKHRRPININKLHKKLVWKTSYKSIRPIVTPLSKSITVVKISYPRQVLPVIVKPNPYNLE